MRPKDKSPGDVRPHPIWMKLRGRRVCCRVLDPVDAQEGTPPHALPLLLIHGLAGSGEVWGPVLHRLLRQGNAPALAPDLPGSGRSDGSQGPLGVNGMADWLVELLDARGIGRTHVMAHSLGCQVALALARRHPTRVAGLVLAGPTLGRRVSLWRYALGAVDVFRESLIFNLLAARMYTQMGLRRYLEAVWRMHTDDPLRDIALVRAPCLVLRGTRDAVIPETSARLLAALLPRGTFQSLPNAAHVAPYTTPASLLSHALPFLANVGSPSSPAVLP